MGATKAPTSRFVPGYSRARLAPMAFISASAADRATSGRRRATTIQLCRPRSANSSVEYALPNGVQISRSVLLYSAGGSVPAASTPMMVCVASLSRMVLPMIAGSALNRRRQKLSLMTATLGAPARSSSSPNIRPRAGRVRNARNRLAVARLPSTTSGVPSPVRR